MRFFHLEIHGEGGGSYLASARSPVGGRCTGRFRLPWTDADLDNRLEQVATAVRHSSAATRLIPTEEESVVREFGSALLQALPEAIRKLLCSAIEAADLEGWPLAVALLAHPPELVRLPWEFLYDVTEGRFPFLNFPLVRCLAVTGPRRPWRTGLPLRMLSMIGHAERLAPEEERRHLTDAVADLTQSGRLTLTWVSGRGWRDLQDRVRYGQPWNVLHFLGHGRFDSGSDEGGVVLEDDNGAPYQMPASRLTVLLRGRPSIRLVVLNACDTGRASTLSPFSSIAGTLVRAHVPAVVAMQFRITDPAAIEFTRSFYGALARRRSVIESVTAARQDLPNALPGSLEWGTPVLYLPSPESEVFAISGALTWQPRPVTTVTAPRDVNAVCFSPDNAQLALACDGRRSRLVDTASWTDLPTERGFGRNLYGVAFSPGGTRLATGGLDGTVRLWDLETGEPVLTLAHPDWVSAVAFSPDGVLATACRDGVVRLWQVEDGQRRPEPYAQIRHRGTVRAVVFEPGGERVATACDDRSAQIWSLDGPTRVASLPHHARVFGVAFSPDARKLATACQDGVARVWDVDSRTVDDELPHRGWVLDVAFSPDGRLVATASRDRTAGAWEVGTERRLVTIRHAGAVRRVAFSPDGRWLATASYDNSSQIWRFSREVSDQDE